MEAFIVLGLIMAGLVWALFHVMQSARTRSRKTDAPTFQASSEDRKLKAYESRHDAINDDHTICGDGEFDQEVVGESNYQGQIKLIATSLPEGCNIVQATLELEDNNPHDTQAVAVKIATLTVGYLPSETARAYRRFARINDIPSKATCPAMIAGGGPDKFYGIWLGIPEIE